MLKRLRKQGAGVGVDHLFNPRAWDEPLKETARGPLRTAALRAATGEIAEARRRRGKSAACCAFDGAAPIGLKEPASSRLPPEVAGAVDAWLDESLGQDYWEGVSDTVRDQLAAALKAGLDAGESGDEIAARVEEALGADASKARAERIARSEVTGSLNAGADAARQELAAAGLVAGKEWLAVIDKDTREEHEEANGQVVKPGEQFEVGGEKCDFPGDFNLSAAMRIGCRCACVSTFPDDEEEENR